jgi:hypothetical protein
MGPDKVIRSQRAFRLAKEKNRCEDFVAGWRRGARYSLSDGATESFDSKNWAKTLCLHFMRDTNFGPDWLAGARYRYSRRYGADPNDWSAQLAFDRGSYATFLGILLSPKQLIAYGVGDTTLFVCGASNDFLVFPPIPPKGFGTNPDLLCTERKKGFLAEDDEFFSRATFLVNAPSHGWYGTTLVLVTDSIAAWIIGAGSSEEQWSRLNELCAIKRAAEFYEFCNEAMKSRALRRDDFTLLALEL